MEGLRDSDENKGFVASTEDGLAGTGLKLEKKAAAQTQIAPNPYELKENHEVIYERRT